MTRTFTAGLFLAICLVAGCGRRGSDPDPAPKSGGAAENPAVMAARKAPVMARMLDSKDLDDFKKYWDDYEAATGKAPKSLADLPDLKRDARKLAAAIDAGTYVVIWGAAQGVIAYEAGALQTDGMVLTKQGVQRMTAAELRQALGR